MTTGPQPIGTGPTGLGGGALRQSVCQVSITHPSPAYTVAVTGTGDDDLNPATYSSSFVTMLNGYEEALNEGGAFTVDPDGRVRMLTNALVTITAYADLEHSANNSTAGAVFSITRGGSTELSPRSVHGRLPNAGSIANLSGGGALNALAGDIIGIAIASDITGTISVRASSIVFTAFT